VNNDAHVDFLVAAANLRAQMFGIEGSTDRTLIKSVAEKVEVPPFQPKSGTLAYFVGASVVLLLTSRSAGVKIPANDAEAQAAAESLATPDGADREVAEIAQRLPNAKELRAQGLNFAELHFEKVCCTMAAACYSVLIIRATRA